MNATQIKFQYKARLWAAALDEMGNLSVVSTDGEGQNHAVGAFHKASRMLSVYNECRPDGSRTFLHSGTFVSGKVVPAICVAVDDENNAEEFWDNFRESMPVWAKVLSNTEAGESVQVPVSVWEEIQKIEGFSDGPDYARTAIMIAETEE